MKPLIIILIFTLILPIFTFAQSNYKPGYVVTLKGDTVKGFIDYQEWNICPDTIKFKKSIEGERLFYGVNDISFFNIDGVDEYKRFTVSIGNAEVDPNKIEYLKDTTFRTATVFLRVMQQGSKVALYSYTDEIKVRYYIGEGPDFIPKELIFQTYLNRDYDNSVDFGNNVSRTITENTFQKQLNEIALRTNQLTDKLRVYIHNLNYDENDMLKIVSKLNQIDKIKFEKEHTKRLSYQFLIGVGLDITNNEPSSIREVTANGLAHTSVLPFISGGITLFPNPNTRQLMFRFELAVNGGQYEYFTSYNIIEGSFVPQVIYNFYNGHDFKVFAGLGLSADKYFYSNSNFATRDFTTSWVLKAGIQVNEHLAFQVQYIENVSNARYVLTGVNYMFK
jgi:hypothetical protein